MFSIGQLIALIILADIVKVAPPSIFSGSIETLENCIGLTFGSSSEKI